MPFFTPTLLVISYFNLTATLVGFARAVFEANCPVLIPASQHC